MLRWTASRSLWVHPLVGDQVNGMLLQTLGDDSFKGFVVAIFIQDWLPGIDAIQGMVDRSRFVGSWRSRHVNHLERLINESHVAIHH
jgi:hypothetical protein